VTVKLRYVVPGRCLVVVFCLWLLALPVLAELLACPVRLEKLSDGPRQKFLIRNSAKVPVTIRMTATQTNARSDHQLPRLYVIPARGQVDGPTFQAADPGYKWEYKTDFQYQFGDYRLTESPGSFDLPWEKGQSYQCIQAFHGEYSHHDEVAYAVDFDMPQGTPVVAARDGVVVSVIQHFTEGGPSRAYYDKANVVMLAHSDGTVTRYLHLQPRSVKVRLGQNVSTGDILALSGNTGMSSGPHLHFEVARPGENLVTRTISFTLRISGREEQPLKGQVYRK
jgi:murein DD-endopeptidase MepM/ murein hydrolase activator NlpD